MKKRGVSWLFILVGLPILTYIVMRPYMDEVSSKREVSRSAYSVIAKEYPTLSLTAQEAINQRLAKGFLIVNDLAPIYDVMLAERTSGIQVHPAPDFGDDDGDESLGGIVLRSVTNSPTQSKAKDLLLGYAEL